MRAPGRNAADGECKRRRVGGDKARAPGQRPGSRPDPSINGDTSRFPVQVAAY